jgi:hypothetical protein
MTRGRAKVTVTLDFYVELSATMERNDYGVPGSPVWYEPGDVDVVSIALDDQEWTEQEFADVWGEKLAGLVVESASDMAEDWEPEE